MMRRGPTIKGFYLEWEGLRVSGAIDSMDVPNELEIWFTSPQPPKEVALLLTAYSSVNARGR